MKLDDKIKYSQETVLAVLKDKHRPVVLCSFGKDSLCVLHLVRDLKIKCPVIFFRDPWQPRKNAFADAIIQMWNLHVFDWPPAASGIRVSNGIFNTISRYQISAKLDFIDLPKDYYPQDKDNFVCGLDDIINRPVGSYKHSWDVFLIGHKSTDSDLPVGRIPLKVDVYNSPAETAPALVYPIRHWDDNDVWDYIERFHVPVQHSRYDVEQRRELEDKTYNSDYANACVRCINPLEPDVVSCPKFHRQINNISKRLPVFDHRPEWFGPAETAPVEEGVH